MTKHSPRELLSTLARCADDDAAAARFSTLHSGHGCAAPPALSPAYNLESAAHALRHGAESFDCARRSVPGSRIAQVPILP